MVYTRVYQGLNIRLCPYFALHLEFCCQTTVHVSYIPYAYVGVKIGRFVAVSL
jgi:hypothetical protein